MPRRKGGPGRVTVGRHSMETRPELRARAFCANIDDRSQIHNLLTPAEQAELAQIATVLEFGAAGTTIYSEEEDAHFLYAISKGLVRLTRHEENGDRQVLAFMWPGDLFGLAERGRYVNSAETVTAATVYRFPLQRLRRLLLREPQLQLHVLLKAAHALRAAQRQIIVLGQQDTYRRLASFLLEFSRHHEFFDEESRVLHLPMTRFDMADYLGMSPETMARAFARLERSALIRRIAPRSVQIQRARELAHLASYRGGSEEGPRPTPGSR